MSSPYRGGANFSSFGPTLTPMVKSIVVASVAVFVFQNLAGPEITHIFGLVPLYVTTKLFLWQLVTYLFLHGGFFHLLFNMFVLWMFGSELEVLWGRQGFLRYFLITGVGAGLLSILFHPFSPVPTIGASGAIYGLLAAYGLRFPERYVLIYFLFPVKVKYVVGFLALVAFLSAWSGGGGGVDHLAHLGGMIVGVLYLYNLLSWSSLRQRYYRWRLRRMRSRFQVHENPRKDRDRDFWIN